MPQEKEWWEHYVSKCLCSRKGTVCEHKIPAIILEVEKRKMDEIMKVIEEVRSRMSDLYLSNREKEGSEGECFEGGFIQACDSILSEIS